jgi:hypothetical protein
MFEKGKLPVNINDLVDQIFGKSSDRGSVIISGANGIVGAGKAMQLASRLESFDIPIVGLDLPGSGNGLGNQFP